MNRRALFAAFGLASTLVTCSACTGGTGSKRFAFEARVRGTAPPASGSYQFVNEKGWSITLSRAMVTLGPVYLNVIPPLRGASASLWDYVIRPAWAAGESHLGAGRVVGEVLSQVSFDALSSSFVDFPTTGTITQEEIRTAEIWFYPEPGTPADAAKLDTVALDLAGSAERAGTVVRFRGQLKLDDTWIANQSAGSRGNQSLIDIRQVRGIPASFFPTEGGELQIEVDVKPLLRGADFASLAGDKSDADGTKLLLPGKAGDQVMTNLYQGLHEVEHTYSVRWVAP
jgi:hypothetical protein